MENICTVYAENFGMTFIMKEHEDADGLATIECVGFYFGEPNEEDTRNYMGDLVCQVYTR